MQCHQQWVRSTKLATEEEEDEQDEDKKLETRQHNIIITIHDMSRTLYTNQTRKFPHTSSRGNKYQMILHKINSNSTWVEPINNRNEGKIIIALRTCPHVDSSLQIKAKTSNFRH